MLGKTVDNAVPETLTSFTNTLHEDEHLKEEEERSQTHLVHGESIILLETPVKAAVHYEVEAEAHLEEEQEEVSIIEEQHVPLILLGYEKP